MEAKTTDYITISLDKIAQYKTCLVEEGKVTNNACVLIIVGREDTGALEAQIRGSRYAWDMRLISVERLVKLLQIKEKSNDDTTIHQIKTTLSEFAWVSDVAERLDGRGSRVAGRVRGLSEAEFRQRYGTEAACRAALFQLRWGKRWVCPACGYGRCAELKGRAVYQCNRCKHQVGLTAGMVFHWTKLPLTSWFLAIYHLSQSKGGMSRSSWRDGWAPGSRRRG